VTTRVLVQTSVVERDGERFPTTQFADLVDTGAMYLAQVLCTDVDGHPTRFMDSDVAHYTLSNAEAYCGPVVAVWMEIRDDAWLALQQAFPPERALVHGLTRDEFLASVQAKRDARIEDIRLSLPDLAIAMEDDLANIPALATGALLSLPIIGDPVDSCIEWMVARLTGDYSQEWPVYFSDEATLRQRLAALWSMWQGAPERSTERLAFRLWAVARMQSLLNGMA